MPVAVPLVAAVAGYAATSAIAGLASVAALGTFASGLISSAAGFVVSSAINMVGGALTASKPKAAAALTQAPNSVQDTVRSAVESHKIIYGQTRVSGVVVFDGATSGGVDNLGNVVTGDNVFRHFVIALAGHECDEIGTIYIENKPVTLDASGFVTDAPYVRGNSSSSQINAVLFSYASITGGTSFVTTGAHGFLVGETVFILVNGSYKGYLIATTPTSTTFTVTSTTRAGSIVLHQSIYVIRTTNTSTRFIRIKKFLGSPDQAASPDLINEVWAFTAGHRLRGIAYIYVRIQQAPEFNMNIQNISAIVKGKKVYDPRTGLTLWSNNPVLCVRDYLTSDYGLECESSEINDTYAIAAANVCEEAVTLQSGATQNRYSCDGVLDTASSTLSNLQSLLTSMVGTLSYVQGQFRISPAAYDAPSATITLDMLAGPINVQARPARLDLFNAVKGTCVDASTDYLVTDFPIVTNSTYETQDGGEQIVKDVQLPFTTNIEAAQRLGKVINETARQGIVVQMPLNHSALTCAVNDTVYVENAQLGWTDKIFRIKKFSLAVPGPFTVTLQEEAAASYDWAAGEATVSDPAPDTNLPDPFIVSPPGVPTVTETLYITRNNAGVKSQATMTWSPSLDRYARWYVPEFKLTSSISWTVLSQTGDTTVALPDMAPGTYQFRVKCINHIGASSDYATASPKEILGLSAPPADVSGLTIQGMWGQARLTWNLPTDLDVLSGGAILIRHSEATSGATWEGSTSIGNQTIAADANGYTLPLKAGTYLAKFQDSTGQVSVNATSVTTKTVSLIAFSDIITVSADPSFSGTFSNTYADSGTLRLSGVTLFDDIVDFDSIASLDSEGGVSSSGTFTLSGYTDLTTVQSIRLQSQIVLTTANVLDRMDSKLGFMDDWLDFDGTANGGAVDCYVEVSETDDDPSASPTWTPYNRLDVADVNCRAFRWRAQLTSNDPAFSPYVSTLNVTARQLT